MGRRAFLGAELALRYALAYPARTRGLVYLAGTGIGDGFRAAYRAEMRRRLGGDLPRWQYLHDKPDRTRAEEHEFCLLQWRPDYAPGPAAAKFAAAVWDDDLRVNLRRNRELPPTGPATKPSWPGAAPSCRCRF